MSSASTQSTRAAAVRSASHEPTRWVLSPSLPHSEPLDFRWLVAMVNSDSTSAALAVSATGAKVWANAVVEYLVVTNRFDGLGLEDDRGGDVIGAQAAGLDGLVAIFAGALVEGIDQRVDCDVVVIFNFHQAKNIGVHLEDGRDDLVFLALEFFGIIGAA